MLMHLAVPHEFDSIIQVDNSGDSSGKMITSFDEMSDTEIRKLWAESFEKNDNRSLNFNFLHSLK